MGEQATARIQLNQHFAQRVGDIKRIVGLMPATYLVELIDVLDLDANPRNSKLGNVTDAILASIEADETATFHKLFPFKSKGILLASSGYTDLGDGRFKLSFVNRETEGILDGGHNTLAIGSYILEQAEKALGKPAPKRKAVSYWDAFKETWNKQRGDIDCYLNCILTDRGGLARDGIGTLDFEIPVEVLVPAATDDDACIESFRMSLLAICDARNNNAQLTQGTKGNQEGLFNPLRDLFHEKSPEFEQTISWKTNDGGSIQSRSLVALAWIPLSLTSLAQPKTSAVEPPNPTSIYASKEKCLERFLQLMRDDRVSRPIGSSKREVYNREILSALRVATDLPWLFDTVYQLFPDYYAGSYGKITAVKGLLNKNDSYQTPFLGQQAKRPVPDGFIYPLVYGLKAIMDVDKVTGEVKWVTDPFLFLQSRAYKEVVGRYSGVIQQSDYDPQKVGKGAFSYDSAVSFTKLGYIDMKDQPHGQGRLFE